MSRETRMLTCMGFFLPGGRSEFAEHVVGTRGGLLAHHFHGVGADQVVFRNLTFNEVVRSVLLLERTAELFVVNTDALKVGLAGQKIVAPESGLLLPEEEVLRGEEIIGVLGGE